MFLSFPREMAFPERSGPYRIVYNVEQMIECINKLNGRKNIYTSVFSFKKLKTNQYGQIIPDYNSVIIDKLPFDMDNEKSLINVKKMHEILISEDIAHTFLMSGKGVHSYIFTNEGDLEYPKQALKNAQIFFANKVGLSIGDPIIGDIARVMGMPYTYNIKHKRWRIPLTEKDLDCSLDEIREMASRNDCHNLKYPIKIFGRKLIDMKLFDYLPPIDQNDDEIAIPALEHMKHISKEKFWPCVENMIVKQSGCHPWYWATIWLRDMGYSKKEADKIMEFYLSQFKRTDGYINDYQHYKFSDRHLDKVDSRLYIHQSV